MKQFKLRTHRYPHHQVTLFDAGHTPFLSIRRNTKKEIIEKLKQTAFDHAYLKVTYGPGYWNDSTVSTWEDLLAVWNDFTEKALLDYLQSTKEG